MTKITQVFSVAASLAVLSISFSAQAGGKVSVFGAGVMPQSVNVTESGVTAQITGKLGFGGGLLLEWVPNPTLGLETGGVFLSRSFGATIAGVDTGITSTQKSVYVPVGLRIRAGRVLSFQGGGFYDQVVDEGGGSNYGLQGGLRINVPLGGTTSLFVEGRYNYGLKDQGGYKVSDLVLAFVGLSFGGGGR